MQNPNIYKAHNFEVYPLELFILALGFILGVIVGSLNDKTQKNQQEQTLKSQNQQKPQKIIYSSSISTQTPQHLILSYSLSMGQSFQSHGKRLKMFKGHLYEYMPLVFHQNQQGFPTSYEVSHSAITKTLKQSQWIKLYNPLCKLPKYGKFYFNVFVIKNQYFVKRQASQKTLSSVAVSRTDIIVGFFLAKQQPDIIKLTQQVDNICRQSQRQPINNTVGLSAYGFNGRIYNNGEVRTEEKLIKKNRTFSVMINRDEGFLAYELQGETVGFSILPKDRPQIIPFVEMYAVGSSIIITG